MTDKPIFQDLLYFQRATDAKLAFCLTYENFAGLKYVHTGTGALYSTFDHDTQKSMIANLLNKVQNINDQVLNAFLDSLAIFQPLLVTNQATTTVVLQAFRDAVQNDQEYIVRQSPPMDPIPQLPQGISPNGYYPVQLQEWSLVFYDRGNGVFQWNSYVDAMLNLIYHYFKLGA